MPGLPTSLHCWRPRTLTWRIETKDVCLVILRDFVVDWAQPSPPRREDTKNQVAGCFLPSVLDSGQPDILKAKVSLAAHPKPPSEWFPWSAVLFRRAP